MLFKTKIAGMNYVSDITTLFVDLKFNKIVKLKQEPHNPHDKNAILILCDDKKIGYIPRYKTEI
ncbi:MAG: HIRAN domain-containing protein [Campylobacter sp.]|nr:HIRAN domain-containing protein [Campylobacter sp.]